MVENMGFFLRQLLQDTISHVWREYFAARGPYEVWYEDRVDGQREIKHPLDLVAQEYAIDILQRFFPGVAIVAEEPMAGTMQQLPGGDQPYFVLDGLDGTRLFNMGSPIGVSAMIAYVENRTTVVAYIADYHSGEIIGFEKNGQVKRYFRGHAFLAQPACTTPLHEQTLLLRDRPHETFGDAAIVAASHHDRGLFKEINIMRGSIGLWYRQLWTGQVGALGIKPMVDTPWDRAAVVAISEKLGFVCLTLKGPYSLEDRMCVPLQPIKVEHPRVVLHHNHVAQWDVWASKAFPKKARIAKAK